MLFIWPMRVVPCCHSATFLLKPSALAALLKLPDVQLSALSRFMNKRGASYLIFEAWSVPSVGPLGHGPIKILLMDQICSGDNEELNLLAVDMAEPSFVAR